MCLQSRSNESAGASDAGRERLNVDSPTFTPSSIASTSRSVTPKNSTISPRAASAAPFTPKSIHASLGTSPASVRADVETPEWNTPDIPEFVPQTFHSLPMADPSSSTFYGHTPTSVPTPLPAGDPPHAQVNPYAQDSSGSGYFNNQASFAQPLQYHLYAPVGPHRENLLPHQRNVHDFFLSDTLREDMQRQAEASSQVLPNSTLPTQVDHFHSLVPLDTVNQKSATTFGYPSWIYKAVSAKDGRLYALRRLEGYRLTNERSIRSVQAWKRVNNAGVVTVHDAFTTGAFGDRSLVFVTDYHPLSKTLCEQHFGPMARYTGRSSGSLVPEPVLWSYMVQIASALKTIYGLGLAARMIEPSKMLMTSKNRIRLNACAILDVLQFDLQRSLPELQQEDLIRFGRLILSLATNNPAALQGTANLLDHLPHAYSPAFKECLGWLLSQPQGGTVKTIDNFIQGIAGQIMTTYDSTLHETDQYHSELARELENARLVRLLTKLGLINERPEFEHDRQWSETGDRYFLKLFRDYVFHQVDAHGNPVVDLAHILTCLAKLDAGIDERISLVSRDEQNCLVVSYREIKRAAEAAFQDLIRAGRRG
ncbi:MAG: PAB-dependent poly(A)-specific ribonuclease subunit 3 [Thelocarpon superellum]|nr:MAG: PAB-dependent poly(A)-specific ribonuclease subunit 3 [Thelocarpon superellum]